MIRERTGKIARLRAPIRDQLNAKLAAILQQMPNSEQNLQAALRRANQRVQPGTGRPSPKWAWFSRSFCV